MAQGGSAIWRTHFHFAPNGHLELAFENGNELIVIFMPVGRNNKDVVVFTPSDLDNAQLELKDLRITMSAGLGATDPVTSYESYRTHSLPTL